MDVNAVVGGLLRDMAFAQSSPQKTFGYKRAASAIFALEAQLPEMLQPDGSFPAIPGIGPASLRIIREILDTASSPTVERAVAASARREDIARRRLLRSHFLSRAEVVRILNIDTPLGPSPQSYRGDLQMHSEWSDGAPTLGEIVEACLTRGYSFAAVTDHSHGLPIAGGMSMEDAARQRIEIDRINALHAGRFRLLRGIEANIAIDGGLDLSADEATQFELVLAAPHSKLRKQDDQTDRLSRAIQNRAVHILAHPRGRITGSRAGIVADWKRIFAEAALAGVAIEIDGDPARQDVDYTLAAEALTAGCIFALDSDAHTTSQLRYAETALAHARLASIPADRIVNCWAIDRLLTWLTNRSSAVLSAR